MMQETFLTVSRKAATFEPGSHFVAWACGIARLKVLENLRQRQRATVLSEAAAIALTEDAPAPEVTARREAALARCLEKVASKARDLLWRWYSSRQSSDEMGTAHGMTPIGGARALMDKAVSGVRFIHFNGAGGNITAGKYNDGSPENRPVLAERVFAGMKAAWDAQKKQTITAADLEWRAKPVVLPVRHPNAEPRLLATLADAKKPFAQRAFAARDIIFIRRLATGGTIPLSSFDVESGDKARLELLDHRVVAPSTANDKPSSSLCDMAVTHAVTSLAMRYLHRSRKSASCHCWRVPTRAWRRWRGRVRRRC